VAMGVGGRVGATGYRRVYGIDFSGAKDAGYRIWIASGVVDEDTLLIEVCYRARELPGSARDRGRCLEALRCFMEFSPPQAAGLPAGFTLSCTCCHRTFVLYYQQPHMASRRWNTSKTKIKYI
jgi:hypothetical protein